MTHVRAIPEDQIESYLLVYYSVCVVSKRKSTTVSIVVEVEFMPCTIQSEKQLGKRLPK
jgi:hypothetical protein